MILPLGVTTIRLFVNPYVIQYIKNRTVQFVSSSVNHCAGYKRHKDVSYLWPLHDMTAFLAGACNGKLLRNVSRLCSFILALQSIIYPSLSWRPGTIELNTVYLHQHWITQCTSKKSHWRNCLYSSQELCDCRVSIIPGSSEWDHSLICSHAVIEGKNNHNYQITWEAKLMCWG